jgi:NADH-quinone oxidoreductase subunit L
VIFGSTMLTIMGIGLFCGAIGKSAQFPLHVWLPDAMEGPTPVSALIHAATMVAAGVYLVGRIFPILTPDAKLFIAIIGCTTLTMAALIAVAQSDIKKVLAYSTLSQLGYMILAMGLGSWVGGLFHLITHAFFKALLFLGSGSVIHAAHHEQEMTQYGGLVRKLPITAATFGIAVLAIAGVGFSFRGHEIGFAGYFSKDLIVANAGAMATLAEQTGRSSWFWALFILPVAIAYVTPFYMMRCWMLTFWGKPRNQHVYDHAHESPLLYVPLLLLAMLSIVGGNLLGVRELLQRAIVESDHYVQALASHNEFYAGRTISIFDRAWPGEAPGAGQSEAQSLPAAASAPAPEHASAAHDPLESGYHLMHTWVFPSFLVGLGLGLVVYVRGYAVADVLMRVPPVRAIHTWLYRRMYFDELYQFVFISVTMGLSRLSGWIDAKLVDGIVNLSATTVRKLSDLVGLHDTYVVDGAVNGLADLAQDLGAAVRAPQTGRIRLYVTILLAAVAVGLAGAVVVALS